MKRPTSQHGETGCSALRQSPPPRSRRLSPYSRWPFCPWEIALREKTGVMCSPEWDAPVSLRSHLWLIRDSVHRLPDSRVSSTIGGRRRHAMLGNGTGDSKAVLQPRGQNQGQPSGNYTEPHSPSGAQSMRTLAHVRALARFLVLRESRWLVAVEAAMPHTSSPFPTISPSHTATTADVGGGVALLRRRRLRRLLAPRWIRTAPPTSRLLRDTSD